MMNYNPPCYADLAHLCGFRKEAHRQMGLPFFVLNHLLSVLEHKGRHRTIELGGDLEDNNAIHFLYEKGGLRVEKQWPLFRKTLRV
jgi:hypothetical protein